MQMISRLILSAAALLWLATSAVADNSSRQQKDSLRQVIARTEGKAKLKACANLYRLYMAEAADDAKMDTLRMLLDQTEAEAIRQGDTGSQGMVYGNLIIAHINRGEYDEVIRLIPDALDFYAEHGQWKFYDQIQSQLISAYNMKGDYEAAAAEATKMYDRARGQDNKGGMATALYTTANIYNLQKRWPEQEKCLRECIELLWDASGYDNILTQAYAFLCISLRTQQRYKEVLELAPEYEKAIVRFEKASGSIQHEAWGNFYAALMNNYIETGEYDKAALYLAKLEKEPQDTEMSRYERLRAKALIHQARREYPEALAAVDSALAMFSRSEFDLNAARQLKMEILARMGRGDEVMEQFHQIVAANRELQDVEVNARFDELRTQYEVDKHIAEKERNRHYFLFTLGVCALLALLLGGVFYYNRIITAKNRSLYDRIKEQDRLADELTLLAQSGSTTAIPGTAGAGGGETLPGDPQQRELVARLREYLLAGGNLTDGDIGRDEITAALSVNKNTLTEAVKAVTGQTPMEYLRALKIDEARRMLDTHPELTIEGVAYTCGFNIPSTFYRLFRKQYGISPTEYRKLANDRNR